MGPDEVWGNGRPLVLQYRRAIKTTCQLTSNNSYEMDTLFNCDF